MQPVTDPNILAQLNAQDGTSTPSTLKPVTDPNVLAQLNTGVDQSNNFGGFAPPGLTTPHDMLSPMAHAEQAHAIAGHQATAGLMQGGLDVYRSLVSNPTDWLQRHNLQPHGNWDSKDSADATAANLNTQMGSGLVPQGMRLLGNAAAAGPLIGAAPEVMAGNGWLPTAVRGAVSGAEGGAATSASNDASLGANMGYGALFGGGLNVAGKAVGDTAAWIGNKLTPGSASNPVNPEVSALAARASALGVPIRPGQMSSLPFARVADDTLSRLPMTGYSATDPLKISGPAQKEAFTRAVSQTFGENAPQLTQDVMANAQSRIGGVMDDVIGRNQVTLDPTLATALDTIHANAKDALDDDTVKPITNALNKIGRKFQTNSPQPPSAGDIPAITDANAPPPSTALTGPQYQAMRQRGGMLSALTDSDNKTVAHYGQQIRGALDDAFQRQSPPQDAAALTQARAQYRNLMTVEPLASKAPTGDISPALLLGAVRSEYPNFATHGAGDLGDLAKIGQAFLKEPANSNTAERGFVLNLMRDPLAAAKQVAAAPFSATIGKGLNSAINSNAANNAIRGVGLPPSPNGLGFFGASSMRPALSAILGNRLMLPAIPAQEP